jgi:anti-sigma B factor antagonist
LSVAGSFSAVELLLRTDGTGPLPVLVVDGEVDLATLPRLRNALVRLVVDHPGSVVAVDLTAVTALDDCGLGVLMGAAAHARGSGGDLAIVCAKERLCERLKLTGLDRAMTVAGTVHALT